MAEFDNEFRREVEKMKKLVGELNKVMGENNIPMTEEEKKELNQKIDALAALGGLLKSDEGAKGATIMVMCANKAIEAMMKDLRYVGNEKLFAFQDDEELNDILDFFNIDRLAMPEMPKQEEYDMFLSEEGEEVYIQKPVTFESIIQIPKRESAASFDPKSQTIKINPDKRKRDIYDILQEELYNKPNDDESEI